MVDYNSEMAQNLPIGLFDSGLGGLTVLKAVSGALPCESYIYLGDTARVPYGTKSPSTIRRYALECSAFLLEKGVKHIVVACNTASSVALDLLTHECPCPITGMIDATVRAALEATSNGRIGVIGTRATVASGAFERALRAAGTGLRVSSVPCPLFVPLVEEGLFEGELVDQAMRHYLTELKDTGIDTLILGCTHYPMLKKSLAGFFGADVTLVTSAESVAKDLQVLYKKEISTTPGSMSICVTDDTGAFDSFAAPILESEAPIEIARVALKEIIPAADL